MTSTTVNMAAILKSLYPTGLPKDLTYKDNPLLALIAKKEDFYGANTVGPLKYAPNSGRSATFASAQANESNVKNVAFTYTRNSDYAIARIQNEALLASKNNSGAFISILKQEMESAQQNIVNSAAQAIYGSGSGSIGRIAATTTIASAVLQLSDPNSIVFFEVGYVLQLSATDGGGAGVRTGSLTIAGVDRVAGSITLSGNISTGVAAAAVNDFIFISGDYDSKMKGLSAWNPQVAPSATAFFGVDRTADITRLSGWRGDLSSLPIEEALIQGGMNIQRDGGKIDHVFMPFDKYADLTKSLGSKVQYVDVMAKDAQVGFQGVKVNLGKSIATVIPDRNCPSGTMKMLTLDSWLLHSLEGMPMVLDMDGLKQLRVSNADSLEIRVGYYAQVFCNSPGHNGTFLI